MRGKGRPHVEDTTYVEIWGLLTINYGCYVNISSISVNNKDSQGGLINSDSSNAVGNFLFCMEIWTNLQQKIPKVLNTNTKC